MSEQNTARPQDDARRLPASYAPLQPIQIDDVNRRIDKCVTDNSAGEKTLWIVLIVLVATGLFVLAYGIWRDNRYLIGISVGESGLTIWPVMKMIQLYRRKVALSVIPTIAALLSARDAAREIHSLIEKLLEKS